MLKLIRRIVNRADENINWNWCLKGRVIGEHSYGQNGEIRSGTKAFKAGTEVYIAPAQWGDGFENVVVIGLEQRKRKLIELVMRCKHIVAFEVVRVEDPEILNMIETSKRYWWGNTDEDYEAIKFLAESLNSKEQETVNSITEEERWQYGIVANIVDERIDEEGILRHGTVAYPPGRKVYIGRYIDQDAKKIEVVGLNRFNRYAVEEVPLSALKNIRCKRIYKPGVLAYMGEYEGSFPFWDNSEKDKIASEKHAELLIKIQNRMKENVYVKTKYFSMMGMRSILKKMIDSFNDDYMEDDFYLPDENPEEEVKWADGALDGVYIYHMAHEPVTDEQLTILDRVFTLASNGEKKEAQDILFDLSKDLRAIAAIDELQNLLVSNQSDYDLEKVLSFAIDLFTNSDKRELVKYGLSIIELFEGTIQFRKEFKDLVRIIALNDEFTLFALFVMLHWEDPNHILHQIGQRVYGWGRIHVVERIEADTEEIRRWILKEGIDNRVGQGYSALTCFIKADVPDYLDSYYLAYEDYHSVGRILRALLDEGPVPGISEIDNIEGVLGRYLDIAVRYDLRFEDYSIIKDIFDYAADESTCHPTLVDKCNDILMTDDCVREVTEAIRQGQGIDLAKYLGIDYQEAYFQYFKEHVEDEFFNLDYAFDDRYAEAAIDVYRSNLDLQALAKGADVKIPIAEQFGDYLRLDNCLGLLERFPMKGIDIVLAALDSPVLRNRKSAIGVIRNWRYLTGSTVSEMDVELNDKLYYLAEIETNKEIKEMLEELI